MASDGTAAVHGDPVRVVTFLAQEFPSLTEEGLGAQPGEAVRDAKYWYLAASDLIELRHADKTVGVFVGAPEDWGSYYIRVFAVAAQFQRATMIRRFARECVFGPLAAARIERVVADTSPANIAMSRLFSELRFHVTGHQLSDRWGPLVRYTRFLDPACEAAFMQRFAGTAPPQTKTKKEAP